MKSKKAAKSVTAVVLAAALALSGTFAWQSISQQARNQMMDTVNPGGRLHDDFQGYNLSKTRPKNQLTKDIYVENFGERPIYARVRLDEYMEIGTGAGRKDGMTGYDTKEARSLVAGAKLEDVSTWTTHIPADGKPGAADAASEDVFHKYWTWTMGGEDNRDNPTGKTVYMPTFNKNQDSLSADVNGSWDWGVNEHLIGDPQPNDDYHKYVLGETATRVRDWTLTDTAAAAAGTTVGDETTPPTDLKVPSGEFWDADDNTVDEYFAAGGGNSVPVRDYDHASYPDRYGNAGTEGDNYEVRGTGATDDDPLIPHTAKETETARVISMSQWIAMPAKERDAFQGWVYDADGWAYWSQPIMPDTATGLLLDKITLSTQPDDDWYYGINAVGQFITADSLGRNDTPGTGFYKDTEGTAPTAEALELLSWIGVNTSEVDGYVNISASMTDEDNVEHNITYVIPGMTAKLSSVVGLNDGKTAAGQEVTWTLMGNTSAATTLSTDGTLTVGADEATGSALTIMAEASNAAYADKGLKGMLKLQVEPVTYEIEVTKSGSAAGAAPGSDRQFSASLTGNNFRTDLPQTFTWEIDGEAGSSTVTANATDSSRATLHVGKDATGEITLKVTSTDNTYSSAVGSITVTVTPVTYQVDIVDAKGAVVTGKTVEVKSTDKPAFQIEATPSIASAPALAGTWTWAGDAGAINATGTSITLDPLTTGDHVITVTYTPDAGESADILATKEYTFTVTVAEYAVAATVKDGTPAEVTSGSEILPGAYTIENCSVTKNGAALDPAATVADIEWTVKGAVSSDTKVVRDTANKKFTFTVGANEPVGTELTLTGVYKADPSVKTEYTFTVKAEDATP